MEDLFNRITSVNLVSALIVCLVIGSLVQGYMRGASGSARHLFFFVMEGIFTVVSVLLAWKLSSLLAPKLQAWLISRSIVIPQEEISQIGQWYYTFVTAVRDFPLLCYGILFLVIYAAAKQMIYWGWFQMLGRRDRTKAPAEDSHPASFLSSLAGGTIGTVIGAARALLVVAFLFIYVTLLPQAPLVDYVQASQVYQKGATGVIQPFTGDFISKQGPVFTRAVEDQFHKILERKYEVIDQRIPEDIELAAKEIVGPSRTDEEKAKLLYQWIGTRIQYDHEKVRMYEEENYWKEQTPEDTFATRKGVCIDYSRLYAVMARSVGLKVKVVTGLGYDGQGGYGPHAWNEVYLAGQEQWVPLDTTWAKAGNWFNSKDFYKTHVKEA